MMSRLDICPVGELADELPAGDREVYVLLLPSSACFWCGDFKHGKEQVSAVLVWEDVRAIYSWHDLPDFDMTEIVRLTFDDARKLAKLYAPPIEAVAIVTNPARPVLLYVK